MPTLIKGEDLTPEQRAVVLKANRTRWTVENYEQAVAFYAPHGGPPPTEPQTDDEWLASYSFRFTKDGRLTAKQSMVWTRTGRETWRPR